MYWVHVNSGGCIGSDTINVTVKPLPAVDLGADTTACAGATVILQSSDSYISPNYLWSTGSTSATINAATSGQYWLKVIVGGCSGSDTVNVAFRPVPAVFLGNDTTICPGKTIALGASEPAGAQYSWSTGSIDSSINVSAQGIYSLTVTINGCKNTNAITITEGQTDNVNLGPDTSLCYGDLLVLNVNNNAAMWNGATQGASYTVNTSGAYWVVIQGQCGVAVDTIVVDFHNCYIGFPSAFTPNGDNLNDIIKIEGNTAALSAFSLSIFNRWGQRVFYTTDANTGWDGKFNGVMQDMGTYYYMIRYTLEGKTHRMKGDFQLIR
jgi:gliding motility-associated-like protein